MLESDHQTDRVKEQDHVPALCVMPRIANLVAEYANSTSVACLPAIEDAPVGPIVKAHAPCIRLASVRTDDASASTLRDHLFGRVFVAEHYAARVHRHLLVKCLHRRCIVHHRTMRHAHM